MPETRLGRRSNRAAAVSETVMRAVSCQCGAGGTGSPSLPEAPFRPSVGVTQ